MAQYTKFVAGFRGEKVPDNVKVYFYEIFKGSKEKGGNVVSINRLNLYERNEFNSLRLHGMTEFDGDDLTPKAIKKEIEDLLRLAGKNKIATYVAFSLKPSNNPNTTVSNKPDFKNTTFSRYF